MTIRRATTHLAPTLLVVWAGLGCETSSTVLLESTTTAIPREGAVAASADGRFRIIFEPQAVTPGTEITIETVRDFDMEGLVSHVYRVGPKDLSFAKDARVEYDLDEDVLELPLRFVRVDADRQDILAGSTVDSEQRMMRATVRRLDRVLFAVWRRAAPSCLAAACNQACELCDPAEEGCEQAYGYCSSAGWCRPTPEAMCEPWDSQASWDEPPGSGATFVANSIRIADQGRGFDIDGSCGPDGCIDHMLWRLGGLMNDQIRQGMLGGEFLMGLEVTGLSEPFAGNEASTTLKLYTLRDADDPFFPANNFKVPAGHATCCEFEINARSLTGTPLQARSRTPARIQGSQLRTLAPLPMTVPMCLPDPAFDGEPVWAAFDFRVERSQISGRVASDLSGIDDLLWGGAVPLNTLQEMVNPYCRTVNALCPIPFPDSRMVDLVATLLSPRPDIDLDGDGLECVIDTDGNGNVDLCCDGVGAGDACPGIGANGCAGSVVPPVDPLRPSSCAARPEMADGYSIAFELTAVRASFVGVTN